MRRGIFACLIAASMIVGLVSSCQDAENGGSDFNVSERSDVELRSEFKNTCCESHCKETYCNAVSRSVTCTLNPYENVDWPRWAQYKANFHTHTTNSDGKQSPEQVIDAYSSTGYSILAITDHNRITWPWTDYGKDPATLGMLAVRGDEYSESEHVNAFFSFTDESHGLGHGIAHVEKSGGLSLINHPGRYHEPSGWSRYVAMYRKHPSLVGLEVFNQGDRYTHDRELWDNINENYFRIEGELVWGYSNDDSHSEDHLYRNFQYMIMPELSEEALRTTQEHGAFYFCHEPGGSGNANIPRISDISVDDEEKTISITAIGYNTISWMGPGTNLVGSGSTFDYSAYTDKSFVRAELKGNLGDTYTQPFGFVTACALESIEF